MDTPGRLQPAHHRHVQIHQHHIQRRPVRNPLDRLNPVFGNIDLRPLAAQKLGMSERTLRHKLQQYREAED